MLAPEINLATHTHTKFDGISDIIEHIYSGASSTDIVVPLIYSDIDFIP